MYFGEEECERIKGFIEEINHNSNITKAIVSAACVYAWLENPNKLFDNTQTKEAVKARQLASFLLYLNLYDFYEIARFFNVSSFIIRMYIKDMQSKIDSKKQEYNVLRVICAKFMHLYQKEYVDFDTLNDISFTSFKINLSYNVVLDYVLSKKIRYEVRDNVLYYCRYDVVKLLTDTKERNKLKKKK